MIDVLSVASEAYPLIKTGGLADVTGALARSARRPRRDGAHADPRLPGGDGERSKGADVAAELPDFFGGFGQLIAGGAAGSSSSPSMRRISTTGRATPISAPTARTGPTTGGASRR